MSVRRQLVEEFESQIKELGKLELGTDKHKATVDSVTKLADRIIEIDKIEQEMELKDLTQGFEANYKERQLIDEKKDRLVKNCLTGVNVVGGLGFAFAAFLLSMNFEKTGTLTTEGGRSALKQLLRFK